LWRADLFSHERAQRTQRRIEEILCVFLCYLGSSQRKADVPLCSLRSFVAEELAASVEVDAAGLAGECVVADFHEDVEEFF